MNYSLIVCGHMSALFYTIMELIAHSAWESDYFVSTTAYEVSAPLSNVAMKIDINGSARVESVPVVLDFDNVYSGNRTDTLILSPITLGLDQATDKSHYWACLGALIKIVADISPAYVTSYLIEKEMPKELSIFKERTLTSLPFAIQQAVSTIVK